MSFVIKRGDLQPFLQSETWDYSPTTGYLYHAEYKGASQDLMLSLQQDYVRGKIPCRLTNHQGGACTIEVEDPTQQFTLDTWQTVGNEENISLLSHPLIVAMDLNQHDQIKLARAFQDQDQEWDDVFSQMDEIDPTVDATLSVFYSQQLRGSTEFRRAQYVLRHTTNAPNVSADNVADVGVNQIYTMAQFLSEIQDTGLWTVPCPPNLVYAFGAIPVPPPQENYLWGWLKSSPTRTLAANNRIDISTDYTLYQWSMASYGLLGDPPDA